MRTPRKLLVVDDDQPIHDLVRRLLAGTAWSVDCVATGDEALARLEAGSYDVVLADILMPGMDGLTLLAHIRDRFPAVRVVMMTVDNTPGHVVDSLRLDAAAYVSKPLFRDKLLEALVGVLSEDAAEDDIKVISDSNNWISLQIQCRLATADRLIRFMRELPGDLAADERDRIAMAFRELLINAIEHGGHLDPEKTVDLSYIRTARTLVYYIRDPGEGFSMEKLSHAAVANTSEEPYHHVELRQQLGIRPGGFGLLMTKNFADELIYSAKGNEVIFIKYL